MRLFLPYPPSVNERLAPNKAGRLVLQSRYRAWMDHAAWVVALGMRDTGATRIDGPYSLCAIAMAPLRSQARDLDNILKALSDALQKGGAIEDDRFAQTIKLSWGDLDESGILVEIEPCRPQNLPAAGRSKSTSATRKSPTRRQRRLVATIQDAVIGEASDTESLVLRALGLRRSSTSAASTNCVTTTRKPRT